MFPNIATVVAFVFVVVVFAIFGAATARSHPGRVPAQVWIAVIISVALSIYALVASEWPWIAGSLGVFSVVHLCVGLTHSSSGSADDGSVQ